MDRNWAKKRGLFVNGIWHCDCKTRLPAEKFKCKNGGRNQGRWFYTCQNPALANCGFFLWTADAEIREEAALLNNNNIELDVNEAPKIGPGRASRGFPGPSQSPKRQTKLTDLTPAKRSKTRGPEFQTAHPTGWDLFDDIDWASSDIGITSTQKNVATPIMAMPKAATPKISAAASPAQHTARRLEVDSPSKRQKQAEVPVESNLDNASRSKIAVEKASTYYDPAEDDLPQKIAKAEPPRTPSKPQQVSSTGLPSPRQTPDVRRRLFAAASLAQRATSPTDLIFPTPLIDRVLRLIKPVYSELPEENALELSDLLEQYELRAAGIEMGRNTVRVLLSQQVTELLDMRVKLEKIQEENQRLMAEKDIDRRTIVQLKKDAAKGLPEVKKFKRDPAKPPNTTSNVS